MRVATFPFLRYLLLRSGGNIPPDLSNLRTASLLSVWVLSLVLLCGFYVARTWLLRWLDLEHAQPFSMVDKDVGTRAALVAAGLATSNLPDYASIAIYVALKVTAKDPGVTIQ